MNFNLRTCCLILFWWNSWAAYTQTSSSTAIEVLETQREQLHLKGDYVPSIQIAEQIIRRYEQEKLPVDSFYIQALSGAAKSNANLFRIEKAEYYYQKVDKLYKEGQQQYPLLYANAMVGWALAHVNDISTTFSRSKLKEAKTLLEKINQKRSLPYANALRTEAYFFATENQFETAEAAYLEAKSIYEQLQQTDKAYYGILLHDIAKMYNNLGLYYQAEDLMSQSLTILAAASGKESHFYGIGLSALGNIYKMMGKYRKAETTYLECLEIQKNKVGAESVGVLVTLYELGHLYAAEHKYRQAEDHLKRAIAMAQRIKQKPFEMGCLPALGYTYMQEGRFEESLTCYQTALAYEKTLYDTDEYSLYAIHLKDLAMLYTAKGDFEQAVNYILLGFNANSAELDSSNISISDDFIRRLADIEAYCDETQMRLFKTFHHLLLAHYEKTGDKQWLQKAQILQQAIFSFLNRVRCVAAAQQDKFQQLQESANIIENSIHTALRLQASATEASMSSILQFMEQNKTMLLNDAIQSDRAARFGNIPDELANQEKVLRKTIDQLQKKSDEAVARSDEDKDSLTSALNNARLSFKHFQSRLQKEHPDYFHQLHQPSIASLDTILAVLPARALLLEYFVADTALYCIRVGKDNAPKLFAFPVSKEELGKRVAAFRAALTDYELIKNDERQAYEQYSSTAHWLYETLLAPALQGVSDVSHLLIVPDGQLGHIPFETFLTAPPPAAITSYQSLPYLIRQYDISYSYSASLLVENHKKPLQHNHKILGMAARYGAANAIPTTSPMLLAEKRSGKQLRSVLADLPSARQEVEQLKASFEGDFWFDEQTNESAFKQAAGAYQVLHFAMHGLLNTRSPLSSSFAFTDNGDPTEDNFLEAYEISQLRLNAALVVLSACETGFGRFQQGEGIMSLGKSFMYAGVPSLVASLWEVNDASTATLMQYFYDNLAKGNDKAASLRQAKLSYIEQSKGLSGHPAFWSAFVQLGDSSPMEMSTKRSGVNVWMVWGVVLATGLLAAWIWVAKRKK